MFLPSNPPSAALCFSPNGRSKTTPKRKKAAANPGMKIYSDATANPW